MRNALIKKKEVMQGSIAVAEAVKSARPGVIAAYPITPQTYIIEHLATLIANGELKSRYVRADSEFSAASIVYGSVAAGERSYTASSSQGLLLMTEVIFNMAGTRLPVVITGVNRSISPPINIQNDHQDTMVLRDSGIIQLYVENIQEAVDTHIQIFKIAEDKEVLLPAMVCMDGFVISHTYEPVTIWKDEAVQEFLPPFSPVYKTDPQNPLTYGSLTDDDKVTEFKYMTNEALVKSKKKIIAVAREFQEIFGNHYGDLLQEYRTEDAEIILVAMGTVISTIKVAVDALRKNGKKVGVIKVRSYRPFPDEELRTALSKCRLAVVVDKSYSCSSGGILGSEIKACLYNQRGPSIINYIAGIGGREIFPETIKDMVVKSEKLAESGKIPDGSVFFDLNKQLLNNQLL